MTFSIPDDLAPELYPLAWLVGTWRGYGILTYGQTVPEQAVAQEMTFDHDGGPYLRQTTTIWTLDATRSSDLDFDTPGLEGFARIAPARIWSTETAYWRPVGQDEPDGEGGSPSGPGAASADRPDGAGTDGPDSGGAASSNRPDGARPRTAPRTRLELVSADPAGHVAVWEGWIRGPRAQIGTQAVGRTRTVPLTQMNRMFGLVGGDLMWTQDMAAFGETEPKTYASGRLGRVQGPDAAGIAVPAGTAAAEASAVPAAGAPAEADADAGRIRPIHRFPYLTVLRPGGDPKRSRDWQRGRAIGIDPQLYRHWAGADFFQPGFQRFCGFSGLQFSCRP